MTDIDNKEIRGITGRLIAAVLVGSASVILTLFYCVHRVEMTYAKMVTTMEMHEYKIAQTSQRVDILFAWREKVMFTEPKEKMSIN